MPRRSGGLLVAILLAAAAPAIAAEDIAVPQPPRFHVERDWMGMANDFLAGLTGGSPDLLEDALDTRAKAVIAGYVAEGDFETAGDLVLDYIGDKIVSSVPVVGQWASMASLGRELGHWAIDHFGEQRFDVAYEFLSHNLGPEDWAAPYGEGFFDAHLVHLENSALMDFIDAETGGGKSLEERRRILWDLLKAKHDFESMCDRFGLEGDARNTEALHRRLLAEMDAQARLARQKDRERREEKIVRLAEERRRALDWRLGQAEWRAKNHRYICDVWLGRLPADEKVPPRPGDELVAYNCQAPAAVADFVATGTYEWDDLEDPHLDCGNGRVELTIAGTKVTGMLIEPQEMKADLATFAIRNKMADEKQGLSYPTAYDYSACNKVTAVSGDIDLAHGLVTAEISRVRTVGKQQLVDGVRHYSCGPSTKAKPVLGTLKGVVEAAGGGYRLKGTFAFPPAKLPEGVVISSGWRTCPVEGVWQATSGAAKTAGDRP
ncbi:MAG TPA: hypothetical protein PLJ34_00965 [Hyphomicrobiales bacterium]|nr:hypothetical protein [Kaistiaceae bacterium]HQF29991.1 hypothetical protein [Hyphomicrobiales bacterium]